MYRLFLSKYFAWGKIQQWRGEFTGLSASLCHWLQEKSHRLSVPLFSLFLENADGRASHVL